MKDDVFKYISSSLAENTLSHSFLIETDNCDYFIQELSQFLFEKKLIKNELLINNLNIMNIKPDGKEIKVNEVSQLQSNFSTMPVNDKYNIYIIENAEKMNISAANKLLKFLEEPTDHIMGFLVTPIDSHILPTIKSRCQIFKYFTNEADESLSEYVDNLLEIMEDKDFLDVTEMRKKLTELDRAELTYIFQQTITKLEVMMSEKQGNYEKISINIILLDKLLHLIKSNVNIELVLDKLYIETR